MIEAKLSHRDGFAILTDKYGDEWPVHLYESEDRKIIEFLNEDGQTVNYVLADVIEFLQTLANEETEGID